MTPPFCSVIMITHNSERFIDKALTCLNAQSRQADQILLVDSGSQNLDYLTPYAQLSNVEVIAAGDEIGFCKANNVGMQYLNSRSNYLLFLNPDAFLEPLFIEKALNFMEQPVNLSCAMMTGTIYGYDIESDCPTGLYDTTGIFRCWYGRWYDRGQGIKCEDERYSTQEYVPAICGAVMFCRRCALDSVTLPNGEVMDSSFFMYKEDIDLSLRLRKKDWKLVYWPEIAAYHCRGWNPNRKKMPHDVRLLSARNELRIQWHSCSPIGILYSMMKYVSIKLFDI